MQRLKIQDDASSESVQATIQDTPEDTDQDIERRDVREKTRERGSQDDGEDEPENTPEGEGDTEEAIETELPGAPIVVRFNSKLASWLEELCIFAMLSFWSIWGVLARLGIVAIFSYDKHSVFPLVYAQIVGCLIMGILSDRKDQLMRLDILWYPGLATGFCGSLTTFSSWMLQVFLAFNNEGHANRKGFHNFLDGLTETVITLGMSIISLHLGQNITFYPFLLLFWVGTILLAIFYKPWRGPVTFSLVFAPLGTYLRFKLSVHLNPISSRIPFGTLAANILATLFLAAWWDLQFLPIHSEVGCSVLQGLSDGFCGTLSTVSTFALEVFTFRGINKWRYVLVSWILAQIACVLIIGSVKWSDTLHNTKCEFQVQ